MKIIDARAIPGLKSIKPVHPNFSLRQLVDHVRPNKEEIHLLRDRFGIVQSTLAGAYPGIRFLPIGSHSRGTAIAVHSHVDFLAVLPPAWATWGGRRVSPLPMIDRLTENLSYSQLALAPKVRRDDRGIELHFHGTIFAVDLIPGFLMRSADHYPVYSLPGDADRWIEASPEGHNALFSRSNAGCGTKLRALSQLIKVWRFAHCPPLGLSSLYVDMLLTASDIGQGVKSYGQCMNDFFNELLQHRTRCTSDRARASGVLVASSSSEQLERLYDAAKVAAIHTQAALDAQTRGDYADANREWEVIFRRRLARRRYSGTFAFCRSI